MQWVCVSLFLSLRLTLPSTAAVQCSCTVAELIPIGSHWIANEMRVGNLFDSGDEMAIENITTGMNDTIALWVFWFVRSIRPALNQSKRFPILNL